MGSFRVDRRAVVLQGIRFATENDEAFSTDTSSSQNKESIYNSITSDNLLNDFQESTDTADGRTDGYESAEPETVQADNNQAAHQKDVLKNTDAGNSVDAEPETTLEESDLSDDASNLEYATDTSTQNPEASTDHKQEHPKVLETDVMILDSVLMTCPEAWENLDDLCQYYGTHNLATPYGERLELEEILRLLYQNSMTLPDIIIAINTDREHVDRQQE